MTLTMMNLTECRPIQMYTKSRMSMVIMFASLLALPHLADEENEEIIVTGAIETVQVEVLPSDRSAQMVSDPKIRTQVKHSGDGSKVEVFFDRVSFDIDEAKTKLQEQFNRADENGDGYLEANEFLSQRRTLGVGRSSLPLHLATPEREGKRKIHVNRRALILEGPSGPESQRLKDFISHPTDDGFAIADADGDGQLSPEEYRNRGQRMRDRSARDRFASLDRNQDKFVDFNEFAVEIELLQKLDENQDGTVSAEELKNKPILR